MASPKASGPDPAILLREAEACLDAAEEAADEGRLDHSLYRAAQAAVRDAAPDLEHHLAAHLRERAGDLPIPDQEAKG